MNKDPFLKLQSSKTIEELLNETGNLHSQSWLLSYLDVFVLIVMLIITLISLSDLKIEEETRKIATKSVAATQSPRTPAPTPPPHPQSPTPAPTPAPAPQPEPTTVAPLETEAPVLSQVEKSDTVEVVLMPKPAAPPLAENQPEPTEAPESEPVLPLAPSKRELLQQSLTEQLNQLGLDQTVAIKITEDYAQLEIQDKILFESSQSSLTGSGEALLQGLAPLLKQASGLIFIEGHTDNRPIKTPQFPSNWELGSARATSVLHYLTTQGLDSNRMRAVTYADTMPIADNSTPAGREKNRRVNILLKVQEQDIIPKT
ncbi:MAG: OmpA/MotB family protein [Gammaproteobacteria bacterium]